MQNPLRILVISLTALGSTISGYYPGQDPSLAASDDCALPPGLLKVQDLPEGEPVAECDAVGRSVVNDGITLEVPAPGTMVGQELLFAAGSERF